jgi:hypothetical protein
MRNKLISKSAKENPAEYVEIVNTRDLSQRKMTDTVMPAGLSCRQLRVAQNPGLIDPTP